MEKNFSKIGDFMTPKQSGAETRAERRKLARAAYKIAKKSVKESKKS